MFYMEISRGAIAAKFRTCTATCRVSDVMTIYFKQYRVLHCQLYKDCCEMITLANIFICALFHKICSIPAHTGQQAPAKN